VAPDQLRDIVLKEPYFNILGEPTAHFFHKSVPEQFGFYNADLIQLCDFEFALRVVAHVGCYYDAQALVTFRVHGQSASAANQDARKIRSDCVDVLILLHQYLYHPLYRVFHAHPGIELVRKEYELHFRQLHRALGFWRTCTVLRPFLQHYPHLRLHRSIFVRDCREALLHHPGVRRLVLLYQSLKNKLSI